MVLSVDRDGAPITVVEDGRRPHGGDVSYVCEVNGGETRSTEGTDRHNYATETLNTPSNTLYFLPGGFVKHSVSPLGNQDGRVRYSVAVFYDVPPEGEALLLCAWATYIHPEIETGERVWCERCRLCLKSTRKNLKKHHLSAHTPPTPPGRVLRSHTNLG
jgi:hypothetical protein